MDDKTSRNIKEYQAIKIDSFHHIEVERNTKIVVINN